MVVDVHFVHEADTGLEYARDCRTATTACFGFPFTEYDPYYVVATFLQCQFQRRSNLTVGQNSNASADILTQIFANSGLRALVVDNAGINKRRDSAEKVFLT